MVTFSAQPQNDKKSLLRPLIKIVSLIVALTFIFPFLAWSFEGSTFMPANLPMTADHQVLEIPRQFASIAKIFQGTAPQTVIAVQDLHCNLEIQDNIAGLIGHLAKSYGLNLVGIEGASGAVDVSALSKFPQAQVKEAVGRYFLQAGRISGPDFYAATGKQPVSLEGVEHASAYAANRESLKKFFNEESQGYIYDLREALEALKPTVFGTALVKHDEARSRLRRGQGSLLAYAVYLYRTGQASGVGLAGFPQLQAYVSKRANVLPGGIDTDALDVELERMETELRERFYQSAQERQLDELLARLDIMEKLVNISATQADLQQYRQHPENYRVKPMLDFIGRYSGDSERELDTELYRLDAYVKETETFYQIADQRSAWMVENLLAGMRRHRTGLGMLVIGGYHATEVQAELQRRGVTFISVKPKLTQPDLVNPYFSLLRNDQTDLEKLLAQNQNTLSLPDSFQQPGLLFRGALRIAQLAGGVSFVLRQGSKSLPQLQSGINEMLSGAWSDLRPDWEHAKTNTDGSVYILPLAGDLTAIIRPRDSQELQLPGAKLQFWNRDILVVPSAQVVAKIQAQVLQGPGRALRPGEWLRTMVTLGPLAPGRFQQRVLRALRPLGWSRVQWLKAIGATAVITAGFFVFSVWATPGGAIANLLPGLSQPVAGGLPGLAMAVGMKGGGKPRELRFDGGAKIRVKRIPQKLAGERAVIHGLQNHPVILAVGELDSYQNLQEIYGPNIQRFSYELALQVLNQRRRYAVYQTDPEHSRFAVAIDTPKDRSLEEVSRRLQQDQLEMHTLLNQQYRTATLRFPRALIDRELARLQGLVERDGYGTLDPVQVPDKSPGDHVRQVNIVYKVTKQAALQASLEQFGFLKAEKLADLPFRIQDGWEGFNHNFLPTPKFLAGLADSRSIKQFPSNKEEVCEEIYAQMERKARNNLNSDARAGGVSSALNKLPESEALNQQDNAKRAFNLRQLTSPAEAARLLDQRHGDILQRWMLDAVLQILEEAQNTQGHESRAISQLWKLYDRNRQILEEMNFNLLGIIFLAARSIDGTLSPEAETILSDITTLWMNQFGAKSQSDYLARHPELVPVLDQLNSDLQPEERQRELEDLNQRLEEFAYASPLNIMRVPGRVKSAYSLLRNILKDWPRAFASQPDFSKLRISKKEILQISDDIVATALVVPGLGNLEEMLNPLIEFLETNGYRLKIFDNGLPVKGTNLNVTRDQAGRYKLEILEADFHDLKIKLEPMPGLEMGAEIKMMLDYNEEYTTRLPYALLKLEALKNLKWMITIGGPKGPLKYLVARAVAEKLNYPLLDIGIFYRAIELAAEQKGFHDEAPVTDIPAFLKQLRFSMLGKRLVVKIQAPGYAYWQGVLSLDREGQVYPAIPEYLKTDKIDQWVWLAFCELAEVIGRKVVIVGQHPKFKRADAQFSLSRSDSDVETTVANILNRLALQAIARGLDWEQEGNGHNGHNGHNGPRSLQLLTLPASLATLFVALAATILTGGLVSPLVSLLLVPFLLMNVSKPVVVVGELQRRYGSAWPAHWREPAGAYDPQTQRMVDPQTGEPTDEAPAIIRAHEQKAHLWVQRLFKFFRINLDRVPPGSRRLRAAEIFAPGLDFIALAVVFFERLRAGPRKAAVVSNGAEEGGQPPQQTVAPRSIGGAKLRPVDRIWDVQELIGHFDGKPFPPLLIGGSGFIGSHLVERFKEDGLPIVIPVRGPIRGNKIPEKLRPLLSANVFLVQVGEDYFAPENLELLKQLIQRSPLVYHLAANASTKAETPAEIKNVFITNALLTYLIAQLARDAGKKMVYLSSAFIYTLYPELANTTINEQTEIPMSEGAREWMVNAQEKMSAYSKAYVKNPSAQMTPQELAAQLIGNLEALPEDIRRGWYAFSKILPQGEGVIPGIVLQATNVCGPGQNPNSPPSVFIRNLRESRNSRVSGDVRSIMDVDDVARALEAAGAWVQLQSPGSATRRLLIANPASRRTMLGVFESVFAELYPLELRKKLGKSAFVVVRGGEISVMPDVDISQAQKILKWNPHVPFTESIESVILSLEREYDSLRLPASLAALAVALAVSPLFLLFPPLALIGTPFLLMNVIQPLVIVRELRSRYPGEWRSHWREAVGEYDPQTRQIVYPQSMAGNLPWAILAHEKAHDWVYGFLLRVFHLDLKNYPPGTWQRRLAEVLAKGLDFAAAPLAMAGRPRRVYPVEVQVGETADVRDHLAAAYLAARGKTILAEKQAEARRQARAYFLKIMAAYLARTGSVQLDTGFLDRCLGPGAEVNMERARLQRVSRNQPAPGRLRVLANRAVAVANLPLRGARALWQRMLSAVLRGLLFGSDPRDAGNFGVRLPLEGITSLFQMPMLALGAFVGIAGMFLAAFRAGGVREAKTLRSALQADDIALRILARRGFSHAVYPNTEIHPLSEWKGLGRFFSLWGRMQAGENGAVIYVPDFLRQDPEQMRIFWRVCLFLLLEYQQRKYLAQIRVDPMQTENVPIRHFWWGRGFQRAFMAIAPEIYLDWVLLGDHSELAKSLKENNPQSELRGLYLKWAHLPDEKLTLAWVSELMADAVKMEDNNSLRTLSRLSSRIADLHGVRVPFKRAGGGGMVLPWIALLDKEFQQQWSFIRARLKPRNPSPLRRLVQSA